MINFGRSAVKRRSVREKTCGAWICGDEAGRALRGERHILKTNTRAGGFWARERKVLSAVERTWQLATRIQPGTETLIRRSEKEIC